MKNIFLLALLFVLTSLDLRANPILIENCFPKNLSNSIFATNVSQESSFDNLNFVHSCYREYVKDSKQIASLLILETENTVYENPLQMEIRRKGFEIKKIEEISFNGKHPFLVIEYVNGRNETQYATSFSIFHNKEGIQVESHWNTRHYTPNDTYYNFQFKANDIQTLDELVDKTLHLIDREKEIRYYFFTEAPRVYIKKVFYLNKDLYFKVENSNGSNVIHFKSEKQVLELGEESSYGVSLKLDINKEIENLKMYSGGLCSFYAIVRSNKGGISDEILVEDGLWTYIESPRNLIVNLHVSQSSENDRTIYQMERNLELAASVDDQIEVVREIGSGLENMNTEDFNCYSFKAKGIGTIEVIFDWGMKEDVMGGQFVLGSELENYNISKMAIEEKLQMNLSWAKLKKITFKLINPDEGLQDLYVHLQDLEIKESKILRNRTDTSSSIVKCSPSLVSEFTRMSFELNGDQSCEIQILNAYSELAYSQSVEGKKGLNSFEIDCSNWREGVYYYQVAKDGEISTGNFVKL